VIAVQFNFIHLIDRLKQQNILILLNELLSLRPGSIAVCSEKGSGTVKSGLVWGTVTPSTRVRIPARAFLFSHFRFLIRRASKMRS
jgi:hypothetical protein